MNQYFPNGLMIGQAGRSLKLTTVQAIRNFLPNGGTPDRLASGNKENQNNKQVKNVFAGQLVALLLNVAANPGMEQATIVSQDASFNGKTIAWLIAESQAKIGSSTPVSSTLLSKLSNACEAVNLSFHGVATGYVDCQPNEARMAAEELSTKALETVVTAYPNPSNASFTLTNPSAFDVTVTVYSISGKVVTKQHILPAQSNYEFGLEYEAGMYLVEIQGTNYKNHLKLIKR